MNKYGIDISAHQGDFPVEKLKKYGFVMIRTGYGWASQKLQTDKQVYNNVKKCVENNIPFGFYHYSYAKKPSEALQEAKFCIKIVKRCEKLYDVKPRFPIAFDIEDKSILEASKKDLTECCVAFCDYVEKNGYYASIYSYRSFFLNNLDMDELIRFDKWVADWTTTSDENLQNLIPCGMRQYQVDRSQHLDKDVCFKDYPTIITKMYDQDYQEKISSMTNFKVGNKVKVTKNETYDGKVFKIWYDTYEVMEVKKDRIVIGVNGVVTCAINKKHLRRV